MQHNVRFLNESSNSMQNIDIFVSKESAGDDFSKNMQIQNDILTDATTDHNSGEQRVVSDILLFECTKLIYKIFSLARLNPRMYLLQ
jgi:hypothetical protein